jgi:SAM-dependent methyltransferase
MNPLFMNTLRTARAAINRTLFPSSNYWLATRSTKPISTRFGYDRGKPIDRYWIEKFLESNKHLVKGKCLEITDNSYTLHYGGTKVIKSEVLDIDTKNAKATIHGDVRSLKGVIADNTYDCIILTHVLGLIDEVQSAVKELHRILKPGGVILATSACLSPTYDVNSNFWRFTPNGLKYLFTKAFDPSNVEIKAFGNVLAGQCFWVGMAQEDLTPEQLDYNDAKFPCVVAVKAIKGHGE